MTGIRQRNNAWQVMLSLGTLGAFVVAFPLIQSRIGIQEPGLALAAVAVGLAVALAVWRSPEIGVLVWFVATCFTSILGVMGVPRIDRITLLLLLASWVAAVVGGRRPLRSFGVVEAFLALLVATQVLSAVSPHELSAWPELSASVFIWAGPVAALAAFVVGSQLLANARAIRIGLWVLVGGGIYLAIVTLAQRFNVDQIVYPRQIIDPSLGTNPERARGPLLNSAADGVLMLAAFAAALFLAHQRGIKGRWVAIVTALALPFGIFATTTRAIYLGAALIVVGGALFARGGRQYHTVILLIAVAVVATNLQTFTSEDRAAGGVASQSEIESRLNDVATGIWAFKERPLTGWGVGRFPEVNEVHHQAWPGIPWRWGYGYISHNTFLAYASEAGIIGIGLWLAILAAVVARTRRVFRRLTNTVGILNRQMIVAFWLMMAAWGVSSLVIDVRLFPSLSIVLFAWAGAIVGLDRMSDDALRREAASVEPPR